METLRNFYNSLSSTLLFDKYNEKDVLPLGVRTFDGTYVSVGTTYESLSKSLIKEHLAFKSSPLGTFLGKSSFEQINSDIKELGGSISSLRHLDPAFVPDNGLYILCEGSSFVKFLSIVSDQLPDSSLIKDLLNLQNKNLTFSKDVLKFNSEFVSYIEYMKSSNPDRGEQAQGNASAKREEPNVIELIEIGSFNNMSIVETIFNLLITKKFGSVYDYMTGQEFEDSAANKFSPFIQTMNLIAQGLVLYVDKEKEIIITTTLQAIFKSVGEEPVISSPLLQKIFASFSKELKVSYQLSTITEDMLYNYLSSTPKRPVPQIPDGELNPEPKP